MSRSPRRAVFCGAAAQLLVGLGLAVGAAVTHAETLTVATWNIANLHHEDGVALRDRAVRRQAVDYRRLAQVADGLSADIVMLQEIGSPRALARVFPSGKWHLIVSDRYAPGSEDRAPRERDIHTAVALARTRFAVAPKVHTVEALAVHHLDVYGDRATSRSTRAGIALTVRFGGRDVSVLGVHLKSGCHQYRLDPVEDQQRRSGKVWGSRFDCRTLVAQRAVLESWIEQQHALGRGVIVAGDFNRRLNLRVGSDQRAEDFWRELNDGTPRGLDLRLGPAGRDDVCWAAHRKRFTEHIDFVIHDAGLVATIRKLGLGHDDNRRYAGRQRQRLSDHCPVVARFSS